MNPAPPVIKTFIPVLRYQSLALGERTILVILLDRDAFYQQFFHRPELSLVVPFGKYPSPAAFSHGPHIVRMFRKAPQCHGNALRIFRIATDPVSGVDKGFLPLRKVG